MPKQRPNQPEGAMKLFAIGKTSQMVKRVKYNGVVSSDASKNIFIKVGKVPPVAIAALHKVYGKGLCPAALCSKKLGTWRMQCCDKSHHLITNSSTSKLTIFPQLQAQTVENGSQWSTSPMNCERNILPRSRRRRSNQQDDL